jgi:hypothetical protein
MADDTAPKFTTDLPEGVEITGERNDAVPLTDEQKYTPEYIKTLLDRMKHADDDWQKMCDESDARLSQDPNFDMSNQHHQRTTLVNESMALINYLIKKDG